MGTMSLFARPLSPALPWFLVPLTAAALSSSGALRAAEPSRTPTIPNQTQQTLNPGPKIHVVRVPIPRQPGPPDQNETSPNPASNPQVGLGIQIPIWGGDGNPPPKKKSPDADEDSDVGGESSP